MKSPYIILLLLVIAFGSCKKPETFPIEPVITFKSIYTTQNSLNYDATMFVLLDFTDGDGDIGYNDAGLNDAIFDDPNSIYYNNFKVKTYQWKNGTWFSGHPWDTIDLSARIPYITPLVSNKTLKGEIKRELPLPPHAVNDTFKFEIFIYDRGLHKSNVVTTDPIILNTQ
jgi:hypothetical protein